MVNQEDQLQKLESNLIRVESLCQHYQRELDHSLAVGEAIKAERAALKQKSELASTKIESMIQKLTPMENI